MINKNFIDKWRPKAAPVVQHTHVPYTSTDVHSDIETITARIEAIGTDITNGYRTWLVLAFALKDAMGEAGRSYFNRLSRLHPKYSHEETDKQYTYCMRANGHGVTLASFFDLAKRYGIDISVRKAAHSRTVPAKKPIGIGKVTVNLQPHIMDLPMEDLPAATTDPSSEQIIEQLPTIPEAIYKDLPTFLQYVTAKATSPEERDLMLIGSIVVISSCLPNIYGIYDERSVYSNLFLFVTAPASTGKGRLTLCRELVTPIHKQLRDLYKSEQEEYKLKIAAYQANRKNAEQPEPPPQRMLFIPANSSATAMFQVLNDNGGVGLMFETEGDTLTQTFKAEHGNYSDGLRKAFHHERISYLRRKEREYVDLETPRLSVLLSGTPKQVISLIPSAEDGLFSRFIFYYMNILPIWKDVFATSEQTLDGYFRHLGDKFFDFYQVLQNQPSPLQFSFTESQQDRFNAYFSQIQSQYLHQYGTDYTATVRRLGLVTFRIAMVLTALRIMDDRALASPIKCDDTDFNTALELVKTLIQHAAKIYESLPAIRTQPVQPDRKQQFLEALPEQFNRKGYLEIAQLLKIPGKTAERYIDEYREQRLIERTAHNSYLKKLT